MTRRSTALLLLGLVVAVSCSNGDEPERTASLPSGSPTFASARALIDTGDDSILIDVEVAETPEQRRFGLMFRESLGERSGMVFLFFERTRGTFWMKNTRIPLSIAFFDDDGTIKAILDMEPCKADPCRQYDPGVAYTGAVEVNQGAFDDWNVSVGDRITIVH
jgi:uncharacterized membrane protein (UPF0127 family)